MLIEIFTSQRSGSTYLAKVLDSYIPNKNNILPTKYDEPMSVMGISEFGNINYYYESIVKLIKVISDNPEENFVLQNHAWQYTTLYRLGLIDQWNSLKKYRIILSRDDLFNRALSRSLCEILNI